MIGSKPIKISCVTVTTGRYELLKKSIQCYLHQTYKNRELIVISQGSPEVNGKIKDHIDSLERDDITFLTAPSHLTLGAMRNTSVEVATGEYICQWDDDDLYHPDRIMAQYRALVNERDAMGSAYTRFLKLFSYPDGSAAYMVSWWQDPVYAYRFLHGTLMFKKELFFRRDSMLYRLVGERSDKAEDLDVLEIALWYGNVVPVHQGYHYIYVYHGGNTYNQKYHSWGLRFACRDAIATKDYLLETKDLIINTFKTVGVQERVSVLTTDSIVFDYEPEGIERAI